MTLSTASFSTYSFGPVRVLRVTLGHFLSMSVPPGSSSAKRDAQLTSPTSQVARPEITPGSAWRGARPRASAPEMSTIVRAGERPGRGPRGTHGRRKWGSGGRKLIWRSMLPSHAGVCVCGGGVPGSLPPPAPIASWGGGGGGTLLTAPLLAARL